MSMQMQGANALDGWFFFDKWQLSGPLMIAKIRRVYEEMASDSQLKDFSFCLSSDLKCNAGIYMYLSLFKQ